VTLYLVRHARPLIDAGMCYGALDVPADPDATHLAAQALAAQLPANPHIMASPLQRCEQLAHVLCGLRPDLSYSPDARLSEMNFGCHEGQRWDSISRLAYDAWTADFWQHRFGGAESVAQVMARVGSAWDDAMALRAGSDHVWITHAGVIRAAQLLAQGVRRVHDASQWPRAAPDFGQWLVLQLPQA